MQVVELSPVTERHLATSLGMVDGVLQTPSLLLRRSMLSQSDTAPVDVGKLLRDRVQVVVREIANDGCIQWQGAII